MKSLILLLMIGSAMGQTKLPPKQSSIPPLPRCHDLFAARNTIMPGADQNVHIYSTEINGQACIPDPHPELLGLLSNCAHSRRWQKVVPQACNEIEAE